MPSRRGFLGLSVAIAVGAAGCSGPGSDTTNNPDNETPDQEPGGDQSMDLSLGLETVTTATRAPLGFAETPGGATYIADRPGQIYRLDGGNLETALDISSKVRQGAERGLLGLALHPKFATTRKLYVRYSAESRAEMPSSYSHTFVLSEFAVAGDGSIEVDSERILLEIAQPQGNHNSGPIAFGPDGYLYVGVGDGGGAGDAGLGHADDWYDGNRGGNGQDRTENLLGSLLRIDVDSTGDGNPYGIPDDNPLVGEYGLDEQFAWGLRNPWGISFDGDACYVADVGQNEYEEVNRVELGGNYGWNVREGTHCYRADTCPETTPDGDALRDPVVEYPHDGEPVSGIAVVGGHVYRGSAISELTGKYVFGDLAADGELFVATPTDDGLWPTQTVSIEAGSSDKLGQLLAVARDADDELYTLTGSGIHKIVPAP